MKRRFFYFWMIIVLFGHSLAYAGVRSKIAIGDNWKFHKGDISDAHTASLNDSDWENVNIPHTWNIADTEDELYGWYRGVGWYRKHLYIDNLARDKKVFLCFEAANQTTEVWINGTKVGEMHIGGYTPFKYDITSLIKVGTKNNIAIKVDNSHHEDIAPLSADFTFYGGIYRNLFLEYTHLSHFSMENAGNGVKITTPQITERRAVIQISSDLHTGGRSDLSVRHQLRDKDFNIIMTSVKRLRKLQQVTSELTLENPILWDTEQPYLYTVTSQLLDSSGRVIDEVMNPLGIRWFTFDADKGFFLNGKHLKLIGTNRHQDYLHYGNALSDAIHRHDLKLMKDMGANCMRISHYPHAPAVLEMCDKYGFICFEEIPIINRIHQTKTFEDNCKSQITEMIDRDFNHPCVVAWNMSNEITVPHPDRNKWDESRKEKYDTDLRLFLCDLNAFIKQKDSTRASMLVHCYEPKDNVRMGYHQADFIGYNKYMGWYERKIEDITAFFREYKVADPTRPFFLSEYGAGADVRIHTFHPTRFDHSEEYQLKYCKEHLKALIETDFVVGGTIWNLADFNSEFRGDAIPHINEKGLLTADRKPKSTYYYYKTVLTSKPFICIPSQRWKRRGGKEDSYHAGYCTQSVEVFGNTDEVELFLNGRTLGRNRIENHSATFQVPFVCGENLLELRSKDKDGNQLKDFLRVEFALQPFFLKDGFREIAINCGSYCYFNDDTQNDYLWLPDNKYVEGSWGHVGGEYYRRDQERLGSDRNIMGTLLEPLYQTQIQGIEKYCFDVPDGEYELSFCFAELAPVKIGERVFDIYINDEKVFEGLDIMDRCGRLTAFSPRITVRTESSKGIAVKFVPKKGETILNGIALRKIY